jgi:hypothetical protein
VAASGFEVAERIVGNERAFQRDRLPATAETARTVAILRSVRPLTVRLVASATGAELDWRDPERRLPSWARWHSLQQMAWHLADTESRYYLPSLGECRFHAAPTCSRSWTPRTGTCWRPSRRYRPT